MNQRGAETQRGGGGGGGATKEGASKGEQTQIHADKR